jgi:hypothetical protein
MLVLTAEQTTTSTKCNSYCHKNSLSTDKKKVRFVRTFFSFCGVDYIALIASTGQTSAHAPQSIQASASIL